MLELFKSRRKELGYTQVQLSHLSGVSLPTIQNLEAGKGNPSLDTLRSLFGPLGLTLSSQSEPADWEYLIQAGLPLTAGAATEPFHWNEVRFVKHLKLCCLEAAESKHASEARKVDALQAFLWAIRKHFPTWFRRCLGSLPVIEKILARKSDGRILKLGRQSVRRLSDLL